MSNRKVAFSILLVLLAQAIVPIIPVDATSGRAMPSVSADMTFSLGGSIDDGTSKRRVMRGDKREKKAKRVKKKTKQLTITLK